MPTLKRKLKLLFKENVQLRKDCVRLRQKWTEEIGNKEKLILLSLKPIENLNLRDWTSVTRQVGSRRRTREGATCVLSPFFSVGWHTQERKDEKYTSCRGTVLSAWELPPVGRTEERLGRKGKWLPRGTGTTP